MGQTSWKSRGVSLAPWLLLAGAAGAAWFAYRKWFSSDTPSIPGGGWGGGMPPPVVTPTPGAQAVSTMLPLDKQPAVKRGEKAGTKTQVVVTKKEQGYRYMKITATARDGTREFRSSINGFFTGRLLNLKGRLYAEVRPA